MLCPKDPAFQIKALITRGHYENRKLTERLEIWAQQPLVTLPWLAVQLSGSSRRVTCQSDCIKWAANSSWIPKLSCTQGRIPRLIWPKYTGISFQTLDSVRYHYSCQFISVRYRHAPPCCAFGDLRLKMMGVQKYPPSPPACALMKAEDSDIGPIPSRGISG